MRVLILGYGAVGRGLAPVLQAMLGIPAGRISALSHAPTPQDRALAHRQGIRLDADTLTPAHYAVPLQHRLGAGDVLINVSVGVSSLALIHWCQHHGVIYLDTCLEPWAGEYETQDLSNHALREQVLRQAAGRGHPTAAIVCGANPGLISHFIDRGLGDWSAAAPHPGPRSGSNPDRGRAPQWSRNAERCADLGVHTIQIAERDTQTLGRPRHDDEFANTWSVIGFLSEADQAGEVGWGYPRHSLRLRGGGSLHRPVGGQAIDGSQTLPLPGHRVQALSWTPSSGLAWGLCITHHEAVSTAHHLTRACNDGQAVIHRPAVAYAYQPSPDTVASLARHRRTGDSRWSIPPRQTLFVGHADHEFDELGALLIADHGLHWCGSRLSVAQARACVPDNGPTILQVNAGIAASLRWALDHPDRGVVEPEDLDSRFILRLAMPYLGEFTSRTYPMTPELRPLLGGTLLRPAPDLA